MREILFRGKKMSDCKWVYGDCHKFTCTTSSTIPTPTHYVMGTDASSKAQIWVDSATVGQYTGLTDKNGVKIFEGDIARYDDKLAAVEWDEDSAMFMVRGFYSGILDDFSQMWGTDIEVIGNIHDNPELLQEEP